MSLKCGAINVAKYMLVAVQIYGAGHHRVWLIVVPFLFFGFTHLATARRRPNRLAVRLGIALFTIGSIAALTGLALIQLEKLPQLPTGTTQQGAIRGILHQCVFEKISSFGRRAAVTPRPRPRA